MLFIIQMTYFSPTKQNRYFKKRFKSAIGVLDLVVLKTCKKIFFWQSQSSWFLDFIVDSRTIHSQKGQLQKHSLQTLNDFQKLLGNVNWIRPLFCVSTASSKVTKVTLIFLSELPKGGPRSLRSDQSSNIPIMDVDCALPSSSFVLDIAFLPTATLAQLIPILGKHRTNAFAVSAPKVS